MSWQREMPCGEARESKGAAVTRPLCSLILLAVIIAGCAKSKPGEAPPKPGPVTEEPSAPPRKLAPQVGREEEAQLRQQAEAKIDGAEETFKRIDQKTLAKDQQEFVSTIQSFLSKAREALSVKDFSRAYNLADKALILAEELLGAVR